MFIWQADLTQEEPMDYVDGFVLATPRRKLAIRSGGSLFSR